MLLGTARLFFVFFFFNDTATTEIYTLSLHDALPISDERGLPRPIGAEERDDLPGAGGQRDTGEREEGPVGGLHRPNLKHAARSLPHRPDRPRSPWGRRRWRRAGPRRSSRRRSAR